MKRAVAPRSSGFPIDENDPNYPKDYRWLGERIAGLRTSRGLSLTDVARGTGIKIARLRTIEAGATKMVGWITILRLSEMFEIKPAFFWGSPEERMSKRAWAARAARMRAGM